MPYSDYPHGSIAARGEEIYSHQLREKVESDEVASSMRLLEKHPEAVIYCLRIGFPAAHRIGFKISGSTQ